MTDADDVMPATDAEIGKARFLADSVLESARVETAHLRAILARLGAAERERDEARAEYVVLHDTLDHGGRSYAIGMASDLIRNLRQRAERADAAELDAAYQRARADALLGGCRPNVTYSHCPWCRSHDTNLTTGDRAHRDDCPAAMPAERPADWTPPKEPTS